MQITSRETLRIFALILGCGFASSAAPLEPVTNVNQIVVLYNSAGDRNNAFGELNGDLAPIIASAKSKGLTLVYFDTSRIKANDPFLLTRTINSQLGKILEGKKSWVAVFTHGDCEARDGITTTGIQVGGLYGICIGDLKAIRNSRLVSGLFMDTCHAFSEGTQEMAPVVCATSTYDETGHPDGNAAYAAALADLIAAKAPLADPGAFLKAKATENLNRLRARDAQNGVPSFIDHAGTKNPDGSLTALVGGNGVHGNESILFKGDEFHEVDEEGQPIKRCKIADLRTLFAQPHSPIHIDEQLARVLGGDAASAEYLPGGSPRFLARGPLTAGGTDGYQVAPRLTCGADGKWEIKLPSNYEDTDRFCLGQWLDLESCAALGAPANGANAAWIADCTALQMQRAVLLKHGVRMAARVCAATCTDAKTDRTVEPNSCGDGGFAERCPLNLVVGSHTRSDVGNCCKSSGPNYEVLKNPSGEDVCNYKCFDETKQVVVANGACYYSPEAAEILPFRAGAHATSDSGKFQVEVESYAKTRQFLIALKKPVFECADGSPRISERCCLAAGGTFDHKPNLFTKGACEFAAVESGGPRAHVELKPTVLPPQR